MSQNKISLQLKKHWLIDSSNSNNEEVKQIRRSDGKVRELFFLNGT